MDWDHWYLGLARYYSTKSKDPSTKVGCVITEGKRLISAAYNGFPAGCDDSPELYADRPTKLRRVIHADLNAVLFAKRDLTGCTAYVYPMPPCPQCAAVFCQVGITRVVCPPLTPALAERWGESVTESRRLFSEKNIELAFVEIDNQKEDSRHGQETTGWTVEYRRAKQTDNGHARETPAPHPPVHQGVAGHLQNGPEVRVQR